MRKTRAETAGESRLLRDSELTRFFSLDLDLLCIADTDGVFRRVNRAWEKTLGYAPEELEGKLFLDLVHPDDMESTLAAVADLARGDQVRGFVNRYRHRDGSYRWIEWRSSSDEEGLIYAAARDITERQQTERLMTMPSEILEIMTSPHPVPEATEAIVDALRRVTGFDAVGLRLQEGEDYPFAAAAGYADEFLRAENNLAVRISDGGVCHNADGSVSLECTCGLVLSGQTDPANPLFTAAGSAWTNDSHPLLGLSPEEDPRLHPRNRCIHVGFQSIAIIPVRAGEKIFGLLHLADRRKDQFTPESISFFEGLGASIGVALQSKQAENQQRAASRHARRLIEASLDPLVTISPAGRITDVNEATEAATGMPRDRLIGTDFADYFTEPSKAQAGYQRVLAEGLVRDYPLVLRNVSGALMNVEYNGVVFRNEAGELRGVFAAARDVTERERAEAARRASEERYRTLFEQIPDGVIVFDRDLRVLDCNQQMTVTAGRSRAELVGKRAEEAGASQGARAALEQALRGEVATWEAIQALPGEARKQYLSGIATPLRGADGEIVGVVCVVTDLSERKRAEELIERLAFRDPLTVRGAFIPIHAAVL